MGCGPVGRRTRAGSGAGLGIQPPAADWGGMVKDNKDGIIFSIGAALYPGAAIAALAVSVNLVVDWLLHRTSSLKGGRG